MYCLYHQYKFIRVDYSTKIRIFYIINLKLFEDTELIRQFPVLIAAVRTDVQIRVNSSTTPLDQLHL